jgi:hypothetical protein
MSSSFGQPHPSHRLSAWERKIVTLSTSTRHGRVRNCVKCDAEEAETVSGKAIHDELLKPCRIEEKDDSKK